MSTLSAKFKQSPVEVKRYVLDYSLQLATGENILTVTPTIIQISGPVSPALSVTGIALLPAVAGQVTGAVFYVSGGADQGVYEIKFLATTSLSQTLEDVVQFALAEKT